MENIILTPEGFSRMSLDLESLKIKDRPAIADEIASARSYGDLRENSEYSAAKEKQTMIEAKISQLEHILSSAKVLDVKNLKPAKVCFGSKVTMKNVQKTISIQIVSDYEANIDIGLIASQTPMAIALLGKEIGDEAKIGTQIYEIIEIGF